MPDWDAIRSTLDGVTLAPMWAAAVVLVCLDAVAILFSNVRRIFTDGPNV